MPENIIEIKNLTKKFKDFAAVDDISFNVKEGEIFAFLGPNWERTKNNNSILHNIKIMSIK